MGEHGGSIVAALIGLSIAFAACWGISELGGHDDAFWTLMTRLSAALIGG